MFDRLDYECMARALQLAEYGLYTTRPNPRVGCVISNDNKIVGEGWHHKAGEPHAEIIALKNAGKFTNGATVYVTLEPCSHQGKTGPCTKALIHSGVKRVVIATEDPNPLVSGSGVKILESAGIKVQAGLLQKQAEALNPGFFSRMNRGRPYVRVKLAMSIDGRTGLRSGESRWITSENSRQDVQRLRAMSSAIMTGIETMLIDDPSLNVRLENFNSNIVNAFTQPLRVVLDSQFRLNTNARLLKIPGDILIVTCVDNPEKNASIIADNIEIVRLAATEDGRINLHDVMSILAAAEINEVLVESGKTLAGKLLVEQLVDEIVLYMAPCLLGESAQGLFVFPELENMKSKLRLDIKNITQIGQDLKIIAKPKYRIT